MTKLYKKSEIWFAVAWIVIYVALTSLADNISKGLGVEKAVTAAVHIAMALILFFWMRRNGLERKYGLCKGSVPAKYFLYYVPLVIVASASLWTGIGSGGGAVKTALFVISMLCVGFLEEVIFRGFLFRAIEKDSLKAAVVISSLTFGLGHIVNLFNGSGRTPAETLLQIVFAVAAGFVLVTIFRRGGSLIPCIVFHSLNNALTVFGKDGAASPGAELAVDAAIIVLMLAYLFYLIKKAPKDTP